MQEDVIYNHPLFVEAVSRNLQRVSACSHTVAIVRENLVDPISLERRADLLIAVEDLVNEVMTLAFDVRALTWPDKEAHPSYIPDSDSDTQY
jgi:hypothetical protein